MEMNFFLLIMDCIIMEMIRFIEMDIGGEIGRGLFENYGSWLVVFEVLLMCLEKILEIKFVDVYEML